MRNINIILNLGAPESFTLDAAKKFLFAFLSDPRVLPLPFPLGRILARYIAMRRAANYLESARKIAVRGKSPIVRHTKALAAKISSDCDTETVAAFLYGEDDIASVVARARACGIENFRFVPLYPQNSRATTFSARDAAEKQMRSGDKMSFLESYCDHPLYISAIAAQFAEAARGADAAIVSFHSLPEHSEGADRYRRECEKTAELLLKESGVKNATVGWQSKMGRGKWLEPSTLSLAKKLAARGAKKLVVICPGFSCDCTETLCEIGGEVCGEFLSRGGREFKLVPCLNDSDAHAALVKKLFEEMK